MISNLSLKLSGELPVTREELFELVSSWGRKDSYESDEDDYEYIYFPRCEANECYNLSNLDVSQITDLSYIFRDSYYNGDLSKWDVSNVLNMKWCFSFANFNNDSLNKWKINNCLEMNGMFYYSQFSGNISNWEFKKNITFDSIFEKNKNFIKKYISKDEFEEAFNNFPKWFEKNRTKISNLNVTKEDILEFEDYLSNFNLNNKEIIK